MAANRRYTQEENDYLRAHYATALRTDILAAVPGRTWFCLQHQAAKLGATGRPSGPPAADRLTWHPANLRLLHALYPTGGAVSVAAVTGLSCVAVRAQASRLGLRYVPGSPRPAKSPAALLPSRTTTPKVPPVVLRTSLAEAIARHKKLKYGQPEHIAFLRDGLAGWQQWKAAQ